MSEYYVIQVYTGSEKKAVESIKNNIHKEAVSDCFYVIKRRKKKYQGTWHLVEENCFPGYVFLESDDPQEMARQLTSLRIYARLLGYDKETFYVQPISKAERLFIDTLTNRTEESRVIDLSEIRIEEGQKIVIVSGPLRGQEGKVKKYDLHKRKATVEMSILGRMTCVDLGIEFVERADT